jgi:hypothetical protein
MPTGGRLQELRGNQSNIQPRARYFKALKNCINSVIYRVVSAFFVALRQFDQLDFFDGK